MIDKRLLVDSAVVGLISGVDDWGAKIAGAQYHLSHVRFDRSVKYSGAKNDRVKIRSGILFVYPEVTPIIADESWMDASVMVDGVSYLVKSVISNSQPMSKKIFSYEIEVI
ncbi:minor capsid protein [Pseudolactococcus yaeyamensis]